MESIEEKKGAAVQGMFDAIAHRYDFLNHFLSLGIDILWRKEAVATFETLTDKAIFDIACGTGDLSLALAQSDPSVTVVGADFSSAMVALAQKKVSQTEMAQRIKIVTGDALAIDQPDNTFDGVTSAFGVRNFANLDTGLSEMSRIIKPGGRMVILEFTTPSNPIIAALYRLYFTKILPLLGGIVSGKRSAYTYLPDTVYAFPKPPELAAKMSAVGLHHVSYRPLTFGISCIHTGIKK